MKNTARWILLCATLAQQGLLVVPMDATLYGSGSDVLELTTDTFDATVLTGVTPAAHLVEFYMHTCGHCRAFAPVYDQFASMEAPRSSVRPWATVVKVAAVNCALSKNQDVCKEHGVVYVPFLKYFPRDAKTKRDGQKLNRMSASEASVEALRTALMEHVMDEHKRNPTGWPPLQFAPSSDGVQNLWQKTDKNWMAAVFDDLYKPNTYALQAIIDLWRQASGRTAVYRLAHSSLAADQLNGPRTAAVWLLRRDRATPVYTHTPSAVDTSALESMAWRALDQSGLQHHATTTTAPVTMRMTTTADEMSRKARYFVSETDMLLGMRFALVNEMVLQTNVISGEKFQRLRRFVSTLAQYFPVAPANREKQARLGLDVPSLPRSVRARQLFANLTAWMDNNPMDSRPGQFTQQQWANKFDRLERYYDYPFPTDSDWVHCRGSDVKYRGYTCGLWTTFHAMTVQALLEHVNNTGYPTVNDAQYGRDLVEAIRGWVLTYFSCSHCASHFYNMTTMTIPIETWMLSPETSVTYLWRAHNMVNRRLSGDTTDDPAMPKVQFPPDFLCSQCHYDQGTWNMQYVLDFLIRYYTSVRPHDERSNDQTGSAHFAVPSKDA